MSGADTEWFYVGSDGEQAGPVEPPALKKLFQRGEVTFDTMVWCEGRSDWVEINDEPTLKSQLKPRGTSFGRLRLSSNGKTPPPPPPPKASPALQRTPPAVPASSTSSRNASRNASRRMSWVEKRTVDGVYYYFNAAIDKVSYDKPEELKTAAEKAAGATGDYVWVRDAKKAWVPMEVCPGQDKLKAASLKVKHIGTGKLIEVKRSEKEPLWPLKSMASLNHLVDDLVMLDELNEAMMVHDLRERYMKDEIYTWVGASHTVLISINPFQRLPIYGVALMNEFRRPAPYKLLPPHPFAIANNAYLQMTVDGCNQAILISGESGAGKTEATKQCLAYLAEIAGSTDNVEQKILSANPVLEAFGNAKTVRNNNSSRFGRWMEIFFNVRNAIESARIENYLLEKVRVVQPGKTERSYHIFYGLCGDARKYGGLSANPEEHAYLNKSGCIHVDGIDDAADYAEVEQALEQLAFDADETKTLFSLSAGVLRLGDITFEKSGSEGSKIKNKEVLSECAALLGISKPADLAEALLHKTIDVGSERTMSQLPPDEARYQTDALAKAIYANVFSWLVRRINEAVSPLEENKTDRKSKGGKNRFIGVLDIFGFEIFEKNSFEQLCINYTNEKLQQHFNAHTFKEEEELYTREGVPFNHVAFIDNQPILDLIEKRPFGILLALDDEVTAPKGNDQKWLSRCDTAHAAKNEKLYNSRIMSGAVGDFTLHHYAGDVTYSALGFCEKNRDPLGRAKYDVMALKAPGFVLTARELFPPLGTNPRKTPTMGGQFRRQLTDLMAIINATEPLYIRTVKPNPDKKARRLDHVMSIEQLTFAGVFEAVKIRKEGYPFRLTHAQFQGRYGPLVDAQTVLKGKRNDRDKCGAILEALKQQDLTEVKMGKSMCLYRAAEHRVLELRRNLALERLMPVAQRGARIGMGRRYREKLALVRKTLRGYLTCNDAEELDAALVKERANLGPHQAIFAFWPIEFAQCKERRFLLQERIDLDVKFRELLKSSRATYDDLAEVIRRAEKIKHVPGTSSQMQLEADVRAKLTTLAGAKLDPIARAALGELYRPYMTQIVNEAKVAGYSSPDVQEVERLLALPETEFTTLQLKLANASGDPDRIVNREVRLKQLMLETYASMYALDKFALLRDADEWASVKSTFFTSAKKRNSLVASFLKHVDAPIHLGLTNLSKIQGLDRQAVAIFKNICGFCGDRKLPTPEAAAAEALNAALQSPHDELRIELYVQLMKQLTENRNASSVMKAWDLLAVALSTFPPPAALENFLGLFLTQNAPENKKAALLAAMYAGVYGGARKHRLSPDDVPHLASQVYQRPIGPRYLLHDIINNKQPPPIS